MFEEAASASGDVTLLYRASNPDELGLRAELDEIAQRRGAKVYYLVGPETNTPSTSAPSTSSGSSETWSSATFTSAVPLVSRRRSTQAFARSESLGAMSTPNCSSCR